MTTDNLTEGLQKVRKIRQEIESGKGGADAVERYRLASDELFARIEAGKAKARAEMKQQRGK